MLIALPTSADLRQVARWHDTQAALKQRRIKSLTRRGGTSYEMAEDVKRHHRLAAELRHKAFHMEKQ